MQYDTPDNILAHPVDDFVADFVGGDRTLKRLRLVKVAEAMIGERAERAGPRTRWSTPSRCMERARRTSPS